MARCDLYRVLAEPIRLRLLALASAERLAIGELAELVGESQPNISRHVGSLKQLGLVRVERQGTRSLVHLDDSVRGDLVVQDALSSGRSLCEEDGSLGRIQSILAARDEVSRDFFEKSVGDEVSEVPVELRSYLAAFAQLLPRRNLAVDVGTGSGGLLDVLAPAYRSVLAVDRSEKQLALAKSRIASRKYTNVELVLGDVDVALTSARGEADVVFAVRLLHHAPSPVELLEKLGALLSADGGRLVVLDYAAHEDEKMRDQADLWLGFGANELSSLARKAGLADVRIVPIPAPTKGSDSHLPWLAMVASPKEQTKQRSDEQRKGKTT